MKTRMMLVMVAALSLWGCAGNRQMETRALGGDEFTVNSTFRDERGHKVVNTVIDNTDKAAGAAGQVAGAGVFTQNDENHYNNRMGVHNSEMPRASIRMLYSVNGQNNVETNLKKVDLKGSMDKVASAWAQGDRVGIAAAAGEGVLGIVDMIAAGDKPSTADSKSNAIQIDLYGPNATTDAVGAAGEMTKIQTAALQKPRATILDKTDVLIDRRLTTNELQFAIAAVQAQRDIEIAEIEASRPAVNSKPNGGSTNPVKPTPIVTGTNTFSAAEVEEIWQELKAGNKFLDGTDPNHPNVRKMIGMYGRRITHFGGGNAGTVSESNLWKPNADTSSGSVAVLAHSKRIGTVSFGGEQVSSLSIGNGWRPHVRFSKRGSAYPVNSTLTAAGVGSIVLPNPGKRYDGFKWDTTAPEGEEDVVEPNDPEPKPTPVGYSIVPGLPGYFFNATLGSIITPASIDAHLERQPKLIYQDHSSDGKYDGIPNKKATEIGKTNDGGTIWSISEPLSTIQGIDGWKIDLKKSTYTGPYSENNPDADVYDLVINGDGLFAYNASGKLPNGQIAGRKGVFQ